MLPNLLGRRLLIALTIAVSLAVAKTEAGTFPGATRAERRESKNRARAAQFLARVTFGYTVEEVDALAADIASVGHKTALENWIDVQMGLTPVLHEKTAMDMMAANGHAPYDNSTPRTRYRDYAWWTNALTAPDQLRQRVGWALMQICVINQTPAIFNSIGRDRTDQPRYMGIAHYYDMLLQNGFGNYRDVLGDVTYHPVMGNFLTHIDNKKPSGTKLPDENYAREILQLFSMGEYRVNTKGVLVKDGGELVQNYTNEDIKALARVFTGLRYNRAAVAYTGTSINLHDPMEMVAGNHDFNEKFLPTLNLTLPARSESIANGNAEIDDALDAIFDHPNVGPHIARLLIQRFVMSNPPKGYIRRVTETFNDNGSGERGDLEATIKAILLDKVALRGQRFTTLKIWDGTQVVYAIRVDPRGTEYSRLQEPLIRYTQFLKAFYAQPVAEDVNGFEMYPNSRDLNQLPYRAPSVFNFYSPDFQPLGFETFVPSRRIPNGQLYGPEFQIFTPVVANRYANLLRSHLYNSGAVNRVDLRFSGAFAAEEALAGSDVTGLMRRLDLLLCQGSMSDASRSIVSSALAHSNDNLERAKAAILAVATSPECAIDE